MAATTALSIPPLNRTIDFSIICLIYQNNSKRQEKFYVISKTECLLLFSNSLTQVIFSFFSIHLPIEVIEDFLLSTKELIKAEETKNSYNH